MIAQALADLLRRDPPCLGQLTVGEGRTVECRWRCRYAYCLDHVVILHYADVTEIFGRFIRELKTRRKGPSTRPGVAVTGGQCLRVCLTPLPSFPILCLAAVQEKAEGGRVLTGSRTLSMIVMEWMKAMGLRRFYRGVKDFGAGLPRLSGAVSKDRRWLRVRMRWTKGRFPTTLNAELPNAQTEPAFRPAHSGPQPPPGPCSPSC